MDMIGALPAATAVFLGLFYSLGLMRTTAQLLGAGVPVEQALPMIPLQDHLTRGLGAVFSSAWLGLGFAVLLLAFVPAYSSLQRRGRRLAALDDSFAAAHRTGRAIDVTSFDKELEDLREDSERANRLLEASLREGRSFDDYRAVVASVVTRLETLRSRVDETRARSEAYSKEVDDLEISVAVLNSEMGRVQRLVAAHATKIMSAFAGLIAAESLFVPAAFAGPFLIAAACCLVWGLRRRGSPGAAVAAIVSALIIAMAIDEYADPGPLPRATLVTDAGTVRGSLIVLTPDVYVITQRQHSLRSIPTSQVKGATVVTPRRHRTRSIVRIVFG